MEQKGGAKRVKYHALNTILYYATFLAKIACLPLLKIMYYKVKIKLIMLIVSVN